MLRVWVGLGSNVGDRRAHLQSAIRALGKLGTIAAVSSTYETAPVGPVEQAPFLNMALELVTLTQPEELLSKMLAIERVLGRDRSSEHEQGPRTMDLDLLLAEENGAPVLLREPELELPHPRLHQRRFVLVPLAEIAPDVIHPVLHRSIAELERELAGNETAQSVRLANA